MTISSTPLHGVFEIILDLKEDERGYFARAFCKDELGKRKLGFDIVQVNQSLTKKRGTIRGMHFQRQPKAEKKFVQCVQGKIYDVVINIRTDSKQYGQYYAIELSEENKKTLYIPEGFAHGFQTLTDNCLVQYSMGEFYSPEYADGIAWNDPLFSIRWPIPNPILSERDKKWPLRKD